jgi:hypothetical protein
LQVSGGIAFTFSTPDNINSKTLDYFGDYQSTADWINKNVKPDETILTVLRDGNILHIMTSGNRTFYDINTCIGEISFVPAKSCTPPYIAFWIYQGTTNPDDPRDSLIGISEPDLISAINKNKINYVIVTPKIYYLYYYLKLNPDFQKVAVKNYNVIFRVLRTVQPISSYPNVKWETCIGEGTPEYLRNLQQTYPARYEMMLRNQFGPWMGLSRQDVANIINWNGCEFDSVYPGAYSPLP